MNYKEICDNTIEIAKLAGAFIKEQRLLFSSDSIESKSDNNFVSYVDKEAERIIVDGLKPLIHNAGFITEEGTDSTQSDLYTWIIDPLDGTTNFIHGNPPFAVSIALKEKDKIVCGVIFEINLNECFSAHKDGLAYLNGKQIKVSETKNVKNSLLATGFPYDYFGKLDKYLTSFSYFMQNTHGLRRLGSAATDLAYVACGRLDGFYEYNLNSWDVAAGAFIIEQAGGKVSDFSGGENWLFGKEIVVANAHVFDEFLCLIKKFFK